MNEIQQFNSSIIQALESIQVLNDKLDVADRNLRAALEKVRDTVAHSHLEQTLKMVSEDMNLRMLLNSQH